MNIDDKMTNGCEDCMECDFCDEFYPTDGFQYKIYPEAGVTRAELSDTELDAFKVLIKLFSTLSTKYVGFEETKFYVENALMKPNYRGTSRPLFSEGETYDEDVGIKVAREKALFKYHRDFDRIISGALSDARILCANLERYCDKNGIDTSSVPSVQEIRDTRYKKI